jgi:subtilisin family serine protease
VPRPPRRRLLRSALAFLLLLAAVTALAQLAGVSSRGAHTGSTLVFDGGHERWLVQAPGSSGARIEQAARRLGGGKASSELPGSWYEVKLGADVAAAEAEAAFETAGATNVEPVLPREAYDDVPGSTEDAPAATTSAPATTPQEIEDQPSAFTSDDSSSGQRLRSATEATRFAEQWSLQQESDQDIDAPEAWQTTTGDGALVAVIDTGVDATHPDLAGRVLDGRDFSGAGTGATVDRVGHGTHVASLIAGNGTTIAGVAPDARILPLKVFRDTASGFSMSGYLAAIRYAADQGADVINISLGCGGSTACFSQAELDALTYATEHGAVVIAAAGNGDASGNGMDNDSPSTPDFPSGYELPGIVSVTSSTRSGSWSSWANYGAQGVDLAAPGEGILVAAPSGSFRSVTGTSFSAPLTSGVAALVAASSPAATPADIRARLVAGAVPSASLRGRTVSGGILNAQGALQAIGSADGGGEAGSAPAPAEPVNGTVVGTPPVMSWSLPTGWSSSKVLLAANGAHFDHVVPGGSRAMAHPSDAWRSGVYTWRVVARTPTGALITGPARTYRLTPRLGAWVSSGRVRSSGRSVRLRIGYAATEPTANVRVVVLAGGKVLHNGRSRPRSAHVHGVGSPRRGWFAYDAALSRRLRLGERVTVEVHVTAGGARLTRRFRASVA